MRVQDHVIQLRGVNPDTWEPSFGLALVEGHWPTTDGEILIGRLTTHGTGWEPGSDITIYGTDFRVAGVVEGSGTQAMTVWMSYHAADQLFGPEKGAQLLVVSLRRSADPVAAHETLAAALGATGDYDVYFEDSLVRQFGSALDDLGGLSILTAVIGVAAVTLGAHNLAWLAAEERKRWLGILRSVGFGRRQVARYLLFRALAISAVAFGLAVVGAQLFFRFGLGGSGLVIGGAVTDIRLSASTMVGGLVLAGLATALGTWLSARRVLATAPADLLGRGPGGY
jgi:ABC-type antimicrobial peptide transport system permease subunit